MPEISRAFRGVLLVLMLAWPAWAEEQPATDGLRPGEVLNQTNWKKAEGLLPPEILKHYQNGEYVNAIVDWPAEKWNWAPDFHAGSEQNAGQFDVDDNGTIIEKGSGKQPPYLIGLPFPIIDRADPKAGACDSLYRLADDPRFNHRTSITCGVLSLECSSILTDFFRARRPDRSPRRGA